MAQIIQPWHVLLAALASWINRHQLAAIDYLREENRILLEQLGERRIRFTDEQRRRLAVAGKAVGRKALLDLAGLVTPDTILRWHRKLVAAKWDQSEKRRGSGRPGVMKEIEKLVVRFAGENPSRGNRRIEGALANLGHRVARSTVADILKRNGIDPAPERGKNSSWSTVLGAHWATIAAIDFTTVEVWGRHGLVTMYVLFAIDLRSRRVHFTGITPNPDEAWVRQIGRNLTDPIDGFFREKRFCLMDRDTKFTAAFRALLDDAGTEPVRLPARSPNMNAWIERFMRSIKSECLNRMIFFGRNRCAARFGSTSLTTTPSEITKDSTTQSSSLDHLGRKSDRFDAANDSAGCFATTIERPRSVTVDCRGRIVGGVAALVVFRRPARPKPARHPFACLARASRSVGCCHDLRLAHGSPGGRLCPTSAEFLDHTPSVPTMKRILSFELRLAPQVVVESHC